MIGRAVLEPGVSLRLLRARREIAVDLVVQGRRVARLPVANADPCGQPLSLEVGAFRFGRPIVRLRWRNANGLIIHDYIAEAGSLTSLS